MSSDMPNEYVATDPTTGKSAPMYVPVCDAAGNVRLFAPGGCTSFEHHGVTFSLTKAVEHAPDENDSEEHWMSYYSRNPGAPLEPEAVVWWRDGWPRDEWGRGLSVMEVERGHHLMARAA